MESLFYFSYSIIRCLLIGHVLQKGICHYLIFQIINTLTTKDHHTKLFQIDQIVSKENIGHIMLMEE